MYLYFEGRNQDMKDGDYLGLAHPVRNGTLKLDVQMDLASFERIYDIVRNESPVYALHEIKDAPHNPASETKLVTKVWVGTLNEVPGEGAPDRSG